VFPNIPFFLFFNYCLQQVEDVFKEEKSLDILQDQTRIFNSDESSFYFSPKTENILTFNGDKIAYEINSGLAKASIKDMLAFSASGMM
jgi:hypothetical protein